MGAPANVRLFDHLVDILAGKRALLGRGRELPILDPGPARPRATVEGATQRVQRSAGADALRHCPAEDVAGSGRARAAGTDYCNWLATEVSCGARKQRAGVPLQVACGAGRLAVAAVAAVPVQQAAERRRAARLDVEELGDVRTKGELAGVKGSAVSLRQAEGSTSGSSVRTARIGRRYGRANDNRQTESRRPLHTAVHEHEEVLALLFERDS